MSAPDHVVYVVDDDIRLREAIAELLASANVNAVVFGSAKEYLATKRLDVPSCLVLDVELPDINGLEFQRQFAPHHAVPIIFITGHGDIPSSVRAIKAGAVDFLAKPFSDSELLGAIEVALDLDRTAKPQRTELAQLKARHASLTPREREVLPLVVSGLLNKQAAAHLGISEVTLQIHRSKVMQKMGATSLAQLVRLAARLEVPLTDRGAGR